MWLPACRFDAGEVVGILLELVSRKMLAGLKLDNWRVPVGASVQDQKVSCCGESVRKAQPQAARKIIQKTFDF